MTEELSRVTMDERLSEARGKTARSIAKHGLLPGSILSKQSNEHLGSWTSEVRFVCGRLMSIYPENPSLTKAYVTDGLYAGSESILPVIAERPDGSDPNMSLSNDEDFDDEKKKIIEERMQSSFLIVCDEEVSDMPDMMAASKVKPSDISDLLVPAPIWDQFHKSGVAETLSSFAKVHVIKDLVAKKVNFHKKALFTVPDYEKALLQMIEERKKGLWVHGVRLPTLEDFAMNRVRI